jgi:putative transposase
MKNRMPELHGTASVSESDITFALGCRPLADARGSVGRFLSGPPIPPRPAVGFSTLSPSRHGLTLSYYERRRPYWQPEDAALFVTWRLHGSTPREVAVIRDESAGQKFLAIDRELDKAATGPLWLKHERVAHLGLYELEAWVLMINHDHILVSPKTELQKITKSIESFSAHQANAILGRTGEPFWQAESYDRWVRGPAIGAVTVRERRP